jgi:cellulose synthase operon protein C
VTVVEVEPAAPVVVELDPPLARNLSPAPKQAAPSGPKHAAPSGPKQAAPSGPKQAAPSGATPAAPTGSRPAAPPVPQKGAPAKPETVAAEPELAAVARQERANWPTTRRQDQLVTSGKPSRPIAEPTTYLTADRRAQEIILACETALKAVTRDKKDSELAARWHYEIARQSEYPLGDLARAVEEYQRALTLRPDHVPSIRGARRVLLRQGNLAQAQQWFDAEVRLVAKPKRRAELLLQKADCLSKLNRDAEVPKTLAAAAELLPTEIGVVAAQVLGERRAGNHATLDRALAQMVDACSADPRLRAILLAERARLAEVVRKDVKSAIELYRAALTADVHAPGVIGALERLYYSEGRYNELAEVVALAAKQAVTEQGRALALQRLSQIYIDRLGRLEDGIAALERAHTDLPADVAILEDLINAYERGAKAGQLAAALERLHALDVDESARVGIAYRIGKIYEHALKDDVRAASWYARELERNPTDPAAIEALGNLYTKHSQWKQMVQMRLAEAEACQDGPRRAATLASVARIVETKLNDTSEACRLHARALAAHGAHVPSFSALERLLGGAGRHAELIKLYEQAVEASSDPDERNALLFKIGRIAEDILGNPRAAHAAYERISGSGTTHAQVEALHATQRAAERGQLWVELVRALEQEASLTKDPQHKLALLHRAAEVVADELGEVDGAAQRFKRVLEIDAKYEPTLCEYAAILQRAGRWDDWLNVQKRYLLATPAGSKRAPLQCELGRVLDEHLGKRGEAIAAYRDALASNGQDLLAQLALERLLSAEERWTELVEIYEKVATGGVPAQGTRRLCRAAEILEHRLGKPEQALALFDKVLTISPDSARAIEGRLRLLCHARASKALADAYAALGQLAGNTADGRLALFREAEVRRDELGQVDKAVGVLERIVAGDPNHLAALVALEELQTSLGNWQALPAILSGEVRLLSDVAARVATLNRHALVLRRLGQTEQQFSVLVSLLEIDPNNFQALEQLEMLALESSNVSLLGQVDARLAALSDDPRQAATHQTRLAEALEDASDPAALDAYLGAHERDYEDVAAVRGIGRLASARHDIARIELAAEGELLTTRELDVASGLLLYSSSLRQSVGDIEGAVSVASNALGINPDSDAALERLTELRLQRQQVDTLVQELSSAAGQAKSKERSAALWIRVARILADIRKDVAGAIGALSRVTQSQPTNVEAWLEIGDLYVRDGQLQVAVERYRKVLDAQASPEQLTAARLAMGTLYVELKQPSQALEHLQAVLSISPGEPKALRALLEVRLQRGETEVAASLANQLIQHAPTIEDQAEGLVSLGRIERQRRRPQEAVTAFAKAVAQVGVEGRAASELMNLLGALRSEGQQADFTCVANALTYYLEHRAPPGPAMGRALGLLAKVLDRDLNQPERAVSYLERAIAQSPEDGELQASLANVLERAGRFVSAIDAYRKQLRLDAGRADCYRGISRCLEGLGRGGEALTCLVPLQVLNAATEGESRALEARAIGLTQLAPRAMSLDLLDILGSPTVADPVGNLVATMADGLDRTEAVEVDRYGLSSRDRLNARSGHPLRAVAERVASAAGIDEFDLYVATQGVGSLTVTTADPPGIIVPVRLLEMPESVQLFAFTRIFALLSRRWHACDQFDGPTLQQWYMAALRLADVEYAVGTAQDELVSSLSKRLAKALPWGRRGRVEEAAQACLSIPPLGVEEFRLLARRAAARLASILSDDLVGSVTWVRQTEGDLMGRPTPAAIQTNQLVEELLRGWVSDGAAEVRRRLGIG